FALLPAMVIACVSNADLEKGIYNDQCSRHSTLDTRHSTLPLGTLRPPDSMSNAAKLLAELIALPSVNPAFLPPGHASAGEGRVADFVAVTAARAGLDIEFQKVLSGRVNLLARLQPKNKIEQTILLAPHLDTVPVADEEQFIPTRQGDRLFGRGACDTK